MKKRKHEEKAEPVASDSASVSVAAPLAPLPGPASWHAGISEKSLKFVGAHVSIAKGPATAVEETVAIGGRAFALFVRSARTWTCPPLTDAAVEKFKVKLAESGISPSKIVCHGSYLINPGKAGNQSVDRVRSIDRLID